MKIKSIATSERPINASTFAKLKGFNSGESFAIKKLFPTELKTKSEWEEVSKTYKIK